MTLAELGAQLKEERMGLGLMVEDVAARLKVPARILRAIEEGDVNDLPHTVYTRGFIKGYGLIVGYSNDKVTELLDSLEDFDDDFSPHRTREVKPQARDAKKRKDKPKDRTRDRTEERRTPRRKSRFGLIVFGLLLLCVAGGFYYYYSGSLQNGDESFISSLFSRNAEPDSDLPAPEQNPDLLQGAPSQEADIPSIWIPPLNDEQPAGQVSGSADGISAEGIGSADQPLLADDADNQAILPEDGESAVVTDGEGLVTQVLEPESGTASEPDAGAETQPGTGIAPPASGHEVVLVADGDCWIRYAVDNGSNRELTLHSGDNHSISFNSTLSLRLGRPQSVTVYFDGTDTGINQRYNGPVTLNIPQDL